MAFARLSWLCTLAYAWILCVGASQPAATSSVLVLGSGGLIGSRLVKWLRGQGHTVVEVVNRQHIDLRVPGTLDVFNNRTISFAFFLACEVGGSKFLESKGSSVQLSIVENNILIYQNVLPWLAQRNISFVFTSSYLESLNNAYGSIKRLGERWIEAQPQRLGRISRLWNIYGYESVGLKSHVMADWGAACVGDKVITSRTDGQELRQFLHVDDCAAALGTMMTVYDELPLVTDISSGVWSRLTDVAGEFTSQFPCTFKPAVVASPDRPHISPRMNSPLHSHWSPSISLHAGVAGLLAAYRRDFGTQHDTSPQGVSGQTAKNPRDGL